MMDPKEYNRIVEQKMAQEGLTRQQAEAEYNQFLENPPFYYALDKKADCKSKCCFGVIILLTYRRSLHDILHLHVYRN